MSQDNDKNEPNVVNLADARKRQRTVQRAGAQSNKKANGAAKPAGPKKGVWMYVQLLLFIGVIAYMMQLCRSGH